MGLDVFVFAFSHDQLYVALSRAMTSNEIVVFRQVLIGISKQTTLCTMKYYWNKVVRFYKGYLGVFFCLKI